MILSIKQFRDHVTNESLYHPTGQAPLCERQLKFTGHCIRIPTYANRFFIYEYMRVLLNLLTKKCQEVFFQKKSYFKIKLILTLTLTFNLKITWLIYRSMIQC